MTAISNRMITALYGLAASHGHEWAKVMSLEECLEHDTIESLQAAFENHSNRNTGFPGIGPSLAHVTGTGRSAWKADFINDTIHFTISRPLPEKFTVSRCGNHHFQAPAIPVARGILELLTGRGSVAGNFYEMPNASWAECNDRHATTLLFNMAAALVGTGHDLRWAWDSMSHAWEETSFLSNVIERPVINYEVPDMSHCPLLVDSAMGPLRCDGRDLFAKVAGGWRAVTFDLY